MQELQGGDPPQIGPYRLVGRLGMGGMGKVFLGRSAGGRLVAVKVIREELAGDSDFRARFRREVAGARLVSGLFTAPVVDADLDGPVPWLATAYVPGPSLADAVAGHGPLPAESVLALAAALAEGLNAIHAVGVVHRDLKPSNVLLAADGPRIIDFGIARAAEATALTHTGLVIGSPGFMSPEQAEGREVGPPSDVFSLGAVLTFAATGDGPFGAGFSAALIYRVVYGTPDLEKVPDQVRGVVERCLAKAPEERPALGDLLAELGGADLAADWLPAPITREFPAIPAPMPDDPTTVTSPRLGQRPDLAPLAPAVKAEPAARAPHVRLEPVGSMLARLEHTAAVTAVVFSPSGARMVTVSGKTARLWDRAPEEVARLQHQHGVSGLVFSPDGSQIATHTSGLTFGFRQSVMLWDAATGNETVRLQHRHVVNSVSFSPDSTRIATVSGEHPTVRLWDPATGRELAQLRHGSSVDRAEFSPDGTRIIVLSFNRKASLWDAVAGREVTRIQHGRPIVATAFSPDGTRLITFSTEGTARLWDTATGREQPWDARTRLWDAATGREQPWTEHMARWVAAFSPDGSRLATASSDHVVRLWDPASGQEMTRMPHDNMVTMIAFSPDAGRLATASSDHVVRLWDPASGQEMTRMPHDNMVTMIAFSPDAGRLATASSDHVVRLWDPASGQEMTRMPHDNVVTMIAFSPDGSRLATASSDHQVRLWDPASGQEVSSMPHGRIHVFSPDGTKLANAGDGLTAQLLDTATGTELARMRHDDKIQDLIFSSDGSQLATRAGKTANLWAA
jgi:WD40 repeat protein